MWPVAVWEGSSGICRGRLESVEGGWSVWREGSKVCGDGREQSVRKGSEKYHDIYLKDTEREEPRARQPAS